ncbi:hypothetical protein VTH06DRAFT_6861 [Thermothelomyces fergusii]
MPGWKHAFSLPSEAVKAATPPGTVLLIDHDAAAHVRGDGRADDDGRVFRFPAPTTDPADPLNWPRWQKAACMATLSLYAFVSNYISASIAPALPWWNKEFPRDPRPPQDLMQFVAVNVLVLGLGNIFWVPLSNIFGRRLVLVLSTLLLFSVTCCGIRFTSFTSTLIIRIFQGLGSSASETVVPAVVGDLFFVHERGGWMALYTASLASGSVVGGITGGYVAADLGWVGQFWIGTGLSGLTFLATVLLVPESLFDRDRQTALARRTLPPISRPGRTRIRSTAPKLSLMTLPSMRFTLPSRFRWRPPPDYDDEAALTWYDSSSSIDDDLASPPTSADRQQRRPCQPRRPSRQSRPCHPSPRSRSSSSRSNNSKHHKTKHVNDNHKNDHDNNNNYNDDDNGHKRRRMTNHHHPLDSSIYGNLIDLSRHRAANNNNNNNSNHNHNNPSPAARHRPWTYARSLALGRYRGRAGRRFAQPWATLRLPATWIIMLQYGGLVGGVAVISTVGPQLLAAPPYRWGERRAGLLFVGALVGILLGAACTGVAADRRAAAAAAACARDTAGESGGGGGGGGGGLRALVEPESRVPLLLPALLVGTCGIAVFGVCAQHPTPAGWLGLEFAFGMVAFALAQVPSIWFGYLIDAYDQLASDCFVMICILRGAIPFAWTFFVAQWIQRDGYIIPFGGFTAIMAAFSLLVIPILCGGKRMRIATARYVSENQS